MPTLLEIIESLNTPGPAAEAEDGAGDDDVWQQIRADWQPPFEPPRALPAKLTLEWLWRVLWRDAIWQPDAAELERAAAAWDAQFPKSHEAAARRNEPGWLAATLQFQREHASAWQWRRVQQLLDADHPEAGWHEVDQRRIGWLRKHAATVRPVVEAARTEHTRRYGAD